MSSSFVQLLRRGVAECGSQRKLARELGLDASHINRALQGGHQHGLNEANCWALADLLGESPLVVLRAAGKGKLAGRIEAAYADRPPVTAAERKLLDDWRQIPADERRALRLIVARSAKR